MLTGKYWILPDGAVIDTSTTEHAVLAREKILRLDRDDPLRKKSPFYKLTAEDAKRLNNRDPELLFRKYRPAVTYMLTGGDPRWWVIEKLDWIRVAKSGMWLWHFNAAILKRLRNAQPYWDAQEKQDDGEALDIIETSTHVLYTIPVEKLRSLKETVETLRRYKVPETDMVP
jgi:hypothetical protein